MVRYFALVLLVAGCSATPPATTVSTYSPPLYRPQPVYRPAYVPPPVFQPTYLDPNVYSRMFPLPQPPQRVIVQQAPRLYSPHYGGTYPTSRPYQAVAY